MTKNMTKLQRAMALTRFYNEQKAIKEKRSARRAERATKPEDLAKIFDQRVQS